MSYLLSVDEHGAWSMEWKSLLFVLGTVGLGLFRILMSFIAEVRFSQYQVTAPLPENLRKPAALL
jgi:hypothetical protein